MTANIKSDTARGRLKPRREPYWARVQAGLFVGYRKLSEGDGTWVARRRMDDGKQKYNALGTVASFDEAVAAALEWVKLADVGVTTDKATVADVCRTYVEHQRLHKSEKAAKDSEGRFKRLVYSADIGRIRLDKLTAPHVRKWLNAQVSKADDPEAVRRSKDSANRNLSMLKAALNLALKDRLVGSDAGWKSVSAFRDVGKRRDLLLTPKQRKDLIDHCPADLRLLVKGLLLTAARPGELAAAKVGDFDHHAGTLRLTGKTGSRVVTLSSASIAFFNEQRKGKLPSAPLLPREDGGFWNKDAYKKPLKQAVADAGLPAVVVAYHLRHAAISEMIAAGMDSFLVAKLAGTSTTMIDKHYGHLRHDLTRAALDAVSII